MSEFKFACPVCGQHMMCDSSHGGSVMECPTCFQKITAPQAPSSSDPKFILTGIKQGERPLPTLPAGPAVATQKSSATGIILSLFILLLLAGAGAGYVLFKKQQTASAEKPAMIANVATNETVKSAGAVNPAPVDDKNWLLNLDNTEIPAVMATGRLHGEAAAFSRVVFQDGTLTFRSSARGAAEVSLSISFNGALPSALAGQTINVTTNADKAARVTLRWKDGGQNQRATFDNGYALRLEFAALADNRLPGKIYFSAPDVEKSYLLGNFSAEIRKPKPKKN